MHNRPWAQRPLQELQPPLARTTTLPNHLASTWGLYPEPMCKLFPEHSGQGSPFLGSPQPSSVSHSLCLNPCIVSALSCGLLLDWGLKNPCGGDVKGDASPFPSVQAGGPTAIPLPTTILVDGHRRAHVLSSAMPLPRARCPYLCHLDVFRATHVPPARPHSTTK